MTTDIEPKGYAVDNALANLPVLIAEAELAQRRGENDDPLGWLPAWFIEQERQLAEAKSVVKAQAARLQAQIENRRKALWWKWGPDFQAQVKRDLAAQGGKKKSVDYLTGCAGFRQTGGRQEVVVKDAGAASLFYDKACPEVVRFSINKLEALAYFEATGEVVPGIEIRETPKVETFYPKPPDREALEAEMAALLEGAGNERAEE